MSRFYTFNIKPMGFFIKKKGSPQRGSSSFKHC